MLAIKKRENFRRAIGLPSRKRVGTCAFCIASGGHAKLLGHVDSGARSIFIRVSTLPNASHHARFYFFESDLESKAAVLVRENA